MLRGASPWFCRSTVHEPYCKGFGSDSAVSSAPAAPCGSRVKARRQFGGREERRQGRGGGGATVNQRSGAVTVEIGFSGASASAGQEIAFYAKFNADLGWHVTAAAIAFDHPGIARQSSSPKPGACTTVRSRGWVHCCSNFRSKPAVLSCGANFPFSSAATPSARRRRQSRSNCRWRSNHSLLPRRSDDSLTPPTLRIPVQS